MSAGAPTPSGSTSLVGLEPVGSTHTASPDTLPAWALDVQASQTSQGKQVGLFAAGYFAALSPLSPHRD